MCGGTIISDFIAAQRGRKLTRQDLWSEIDASHLFPSDPDAKRTAATAPKKKKRGVDCGAGDRAVAPSSDEQKPPRKNVYRGVRRRAWGKWAAEIRDPYVEGRPGLARNLQDRRGSRRGLRRGRSTDSRRQGQGQLPGPIAEEAVLG